MFVMTAHAGAAMTFVASSRPPRPTSSTTTSHPRRRNHSMAAAVTSSNSVGGSSMAAIHGCSASHTAANSASGTGAPLTCMRSAKRSRYGDVNSPVMYPAARRIDASIAAVLPLPFVPAMCTNCSPSCGSPRRCSSSRTRESPGREPRHSTPWISSMACSIVISLHLPRQISSRCCDYTTFRPARQRGTCVFSPHGVNCYFSDFLTNGGEVWKT